MFGRFLSSTDVENLNVGKSLRRSGPEVTFEASMTYSTCFLRNSEGFVWPSGFWRPGVPRPKNLTNSRNEWCVGLAAEGGIAKKHSFLEKVRFLGLGTSGLQQKHLAKKTLRDLFGADFWIVFCILDSRFDPWVVLGGSGAASPGRIRPIWGSPGGPGRN